MGKCPQPITTTEEDKTETTIITPVSVKKPSPPINNNDTPIVTKLPTNKKPIKF